MARSHGAGRGAHAEPKAGGLTILKTRDWGDLVPLASARDEASTSTTHNAGERVQVGAGRADGRDVSQGLNLTRIPDRHSPSASRLRLWYRTTGSISSYVAGPVRMMIVPTPAFTIILEQRKQGQICVSSPVSTSYPAR